MWAWPASHTFGRIALDEGAGDAGEDWEGAGGGGAGSAWIRRGGENSQAVAVLGSSVGVCALGDSGRTERRVRECRNGPAAGRAAGRLGAAARGGGCLGLQRARGVLPAAARARCQMLPQPAARLSGTAARTPASTSRRVLAHNVRSCLLAVTTCTEALLQAVRRPQLQLSARGQADEAAAAARAGARQASGEQPSRDCSPPRVARQHRRRVSGRARQGGRRREEGGRGLDGAGGMAG